jgi:glycosyltransferase involved in cell wall biosynthesis
MRICYVADGASIHTQRWVNYFAKKGHEVQLICWKLMPGYDENIRVHRLTRLAPAIWPVSQYLSFLFWILQVRRLINRIKPDIVDGHFITVYGFLAACSGFHPLVVSAWGSDVLIHPRRNLLYKTIAKYALGKADLVTCDSEVAREGLTELGVEPAKMRVIFKGVDTERFSPQKRSQELREKLGIHQAPTVISTRSLEPVYNVEMLIKAIPVILNRVPETKFIIAGDGTQRSTLTNLAQSLGVSDSVRFVGRIPHNELSAYLASSDVYVSTSLSDTSHISLQEAMACQLAPVVTDIPANRAWIEDARNGFIVPVNDIKALAHRVVYLLKDKRIRGQFGKANRDIIREKAEYKKEMIKGEEAYRELEQRKKPLQDSKE